MTFRFYILLHTVTALSRYEIECRIWMSFANTVVLT